MFFASKKLRGITDMIRKNGVYPPESFIDRNGRRVLAKSGLPGMDGREGMGSTTELILALFASRLSDWTAGVLNCQQFDDLSRWISMASQATQSYDQSKQVSPASFIDSNGRRVLADSGEPGMRGVEGIGSSTEMTLARFASMLAHDSAWMLNREQYDDLQRWVDMCRPI
jgi:hypothetical protein